MPFFSIIIPTYNRALLLKNLLHSFTQQTFGDFEVIIVDDGGTDHSEEIVSEFNDNRLSYYRKNNGGVSSARNFGLTKAKGHYINFFDSDDLAYPNHLQEAHAFFTKNPGSFVAIFDYEWGDAAKINYKKISNRYKDPNLAIRYKNYISTNCIFIEKSFTDKIRFNEKLIISEDWEYWLKLSALTRFSVINTLTSYIIEHPERGLKNIKLDLLISQKKDFISSLRSDKNLMAMPGFNINIIISHFCSLIALNGALIGKKRVAARYFCKSLFLYLPSIFHKRSLAIIKHLIFTW
jgi:glycosyltransferase involved in cell wall biosynthesis